MTTELGLGKSQLEAQRSAQAVFLTDDKRSQNDLPFEAAQAEEPPWTILSRFTAKGRVTGNWLTLDYSPLRDISLPIRENAANQIKTKWLQQ